MRELKAIFATVVVFLMLGAFSAPEAEAQDGTETVEAVVEECFETVVTIQTVPSNEVVQEASEELVPPYNEPIIVFRDVLVPGTTEIGVSEEVPIDCPEPETEEPDEVLGISVTPPLAVTGSNVSYPVAAGFAMIGLGGLAVMAGRKRMDDQADNG